MSAFIRPLLQKEEHSPIFFKLRDLGTATLVNPGFKKSGTSCSAGVFIHLEWIRVLINKKTSAVLHTEQTGQFGK